jgi:proteasome lid subunit RPN8/RPN11
MARFIRPPILSGSFGAARLPKLSIDNPNPFTELGLFSQLESPTIKKTDHDRMTESCSEGLLGTWAPPECPFKIAYSLRALDDIRLAVIDAFFSLPRGGAEIGGVLLGKRDGQQVTILDYVALDCEHAFGPSFTLSPKDLAHLSTLLEEARKNTPDLQSIGWYHSHTRSDIFLSEPDLEVHKRYFSSPWQVALVLKPHTFQPTRGGFFFRSADGSFHIENSYQEFVLEPLPLRPVPSGIVPPPVETGNTMRVDLSPTGRVITMPSALDTGAPGSEPAGGDSRGLGLVPDPNGSESGAEIVAAGADAVAEAAKPAGPVLVPDAAARGISSDGDTIHFPDLSPRPRWRLTAFLGLAACLAIGAFGFETRRVWMPRIWHGSAGTAQNSVATSLGLVLADQNGQLRIGWDRKTPVIASATRGTLEISAGGGIPSVTQFGSAELQSGSFTYSRETEKVEVVLSVEGPNGEVGHESASYLGKFPEQAGAAAESAVARQRDELAVEVERLKGDLKAEVALNQKLAKYTEQRGDITAEVERLRAQLNTQLARTKELERALKPKDDQIAKLRNDLNVQVSHNRVLSQSLDDMQAQLRMQQKKRLNNQNADTSKQ